jgi:transposase
LRRRVAGFCTAVDSAVIYSLMLTCRACGVDPLTWLRHVLTELPQREETADIGDLLPFNFSKANAK